MWYNKYNPIGDIRGKHMIPNPPTITIPIKEDEHGAIRVSGTRVTLDTILNYYLQGMTPEKLHEGFPTVPLTDIYAIIAYYLANQTELDAYLQEIQNKAKQLQKEIEANYPPKVTKAELLRRLE